MRIVEIVALSNGGHRNQNGKFNVVPEGWAVIPDDLETPNFPFGEVTVKKIEGVMTVTEWKAGTIPEPDPLPETPKSDELTTEEMAAAIMEGVYNV